MRLNFKRLALLGGHAARGVAKLVGLTPARLDFVTVLRNGPLCQRDIAARLCVSEAVVSRMVRALMQLGLVRRVIPTADRRFRVVSLTSFGRYQYDDLTECEWLMHDEARFDSQSLGESRWHYDWKCPLRELGLAFLGGNFAHDEDGAWPRNTPWAAFRRHHRQGVYREPIDGDSRFDDNWAWTVRDVEPPLCSGVLADPLSDDFAARWKKPTGSPWRSDAIILAAPEDSLGVA